MNKIQVIRDRVGYIKEVRNPKYKDTVYVAQSGENQYVWTAWNPKHADRDIAKSKSVHGEKFAKRLAKKHGHVIFKD